MQPDNYLLEILYPLMLQSLTFKDQMVLWTKWYLRTKWYYEQHKDKW